MIRLPTFTFLNAPPTAGKTTLAQLLCEQDTRLGMFNFAEPLRMALLTTFYPDQVFDGIDLRTPEAKRRGVPGLPITNRDFLLLYSTFLKGIGGPNILGDMAKRRVEQVAGVYPKVIFDDTRTEGDIRPFILAYGSRDCLLIQIEKPGLAFGAEKDNGQNLRDIPIRKAVITNRGEPTEMLRQLSGILGEDGIVRDDAQPSADPQPTEPPLERL